MKQKIFIILFICSIFDTFGQSDKPYIEVTGSAESEIIPNIIIVSIRLKEYDENRVKVNLESIEQAFIDALRKSSIKTEDISVADIFLNAVQQKRRERDFYATKEFLVKFSSSEGVFKMLDNLKNVKLDHLEIVRLDHTDMSKYRLDLKVEALQAATRKADALLNTVGSKRGKPLLITENSDDVPKFDTRSSYGNSNVSWRNKNESITDGELPLKKIKLRFEILARFSIE